MPAQDIVDGLGEPALMAELEGELRGLRAAQRGAGEKGGETRRVGLEVGRKLEEERAEAAGGVHTGERIPEADRRGPRNRPDG